VRTLRGYSLASTQPLEELRRWIPEVLADPVLHEVLILEADDPVPAPPSGWQRIDVVRRPGVMDPVATSVQRALRTVAVNVAAVRTYRSFWVRGVAAEDLQQVAGLLGNKVVEEIRVAPKAAVLPSSSLPAHPNERRVVPVCEVDDDELQRLSRDGMLALSLEEMRVIQQHFRTEGREPTDVELETLAQTWSEHCKHKTLTARVELADRRYDNLLKDTIFAATSKLQRDFCLSVFVDNAGAVAFDDDYAVTFKVETHNHPSALEPYGGAGTGIGGVIRDTMGTGLGARPILSTDVFCVGPLDLEGEALPAGTLPPRRILQGVVAGVRDYGNRMGIPTANGAVFVHADYRANPLVFCGNVGLIPRDQLQKSAQPGDRIFTLGGRTGRDGIHGATFSSEGLDSSSEEEAAGAVQIGNAIEEKRLLDACQEARERGLLSAITDCGAGGFSSAVGEMGEHCGADVELAHAPLKYDGLSAGEIWISEAQERMVLAVPPEKSAALRELCEIHQVEATDLGCFTDTGRLRLTYDGVEVADLSMEFLHEGLPALTLQAVEPERTVTAVELPEPLDAGAMLLDLLASPDITCKEQIVRQYDHEVLAGSAVKPLVGPGGYGPSDACVNAPRLGSRRGIAVGCGLSPTLGELDPYQMALNAIDEAVRNVISVGGRFDRIALLDNFAWPSVSTPESLAEIVRACEACRDASLAWKTPFISGKDSLNNELRTDTEVIRIPPTLLISALTLLDDVHEAVTMDLKEADQVLYLVGRSQPALGGSRLLAQLGRSGGEIPVVDLEEAAKVHAALAKAIEFGMVRSCHDLSEGGLAVAAAEMALAGGLGVRLEVDELPGLDPGTATAVKLFAEGPTRYLLEVPAEFCREFEAHFVGLPLAAVGQTLATPALIFREQGEERVNLSVERITEAFRTGLNL
jgi:phosphoribosylformylglycinamidine synthase